MQKELGSMSKKIAWGLFGIPRPNGNKTLLLQFNRCLAYLTFFRPTDLRGKFVLEIGNERIENLDRHPSLSELEKVWKIVAADLAAEQELEDIEKELLAEEMKSVIEAEARDAALAAEAAAFEAEVAAAEAKAAAAATRLEAAETEWAAAQAQLATAQTRVAAVEVEAMTAEARAVAAEARVAAAQALIASQQKEIETDAKQTMEEEAHKVRRTIALMEITADLIPSLLKTSRENPSEEKNLSEEEKTSVPDVFTKCKISQVLQSVSMLPGEDAFVAELGQIKKQVNKQVKIHVRTGDTTAKSEEEEEESHAVSHTFLQEPLQAIARVARSKGQRVNKLFREAAESDYTCTGPDEHIPCFFNTFFYLQAKQSGEEGGKEAAAEMAETGKCMSPHDSDYLLREGVARVVAQIVAGKSLDSTLARFGLGVVCDDKHRIVFVRVDLEDEAGGLCPVHVSEVLPLTAEEEGGDESLLGLRYLARVMCCSSAEQFGLSTRRYLLELLPSSYQYVRALGSGAFAEVVVVRDVEAGGQSELACKVVRGGGASHSHMLLAYEARILDKLQTVATGVPRLVHFISGGGETQRDGDSTIWKDSSSVYNDNHDDGHAKNNNKQSVLLTSPVGTPLLEHMKSLRGERERHSFARKVFEQLTPVLSAVHAEGIIHGDIKPDNIVVVRVASEGEESVFLIDWGCAIEKKQQDSRPWWTRQAQTHFMSDALFLGLEPFPQDDVHALLLTCLAIRESPIASAPWPCDTFCSGLQFIAARSQWLREYAREHPELDLSPLRLG